MTADLVTAGAWEKCPQRLLRAPGRLLSALNPIRGITLDQAVNFLQDNPVIISRNGVF
jgi:hypothetical protein